MMTKKELITEIRKYRCADLSDAMDALGMVDVGTMNENMRPIRPGIEFKGFAHTVKLVPIRHAVKKCETVEWAEQQPGVRIVEAEAEEDNLASIRVLEKCGFTRTGIMGEEGPRFSRK